MKTYTFSDMSTCLKEMLICQKIVYNCQNYIDLSDTMLTKRLHLMLLTHFNENICVYICIIVSILQLDLRIWKIGIEIKQEDTKLWHVNMKICLPRKWNEILIKFNPYVFDRYIPSLQFYRVEQQVLESRSNSCRPP